MQLDPITAGILYAMSDERWRTVADVSSATGIQARAVRPVLQRLVSVGALSRDARVTEAERTTMYHARIAHPLFRLARPAPNRPRLTVRWRRG